MKSIAIFNSLNGKVVDREGLINLRKLAEMEEQTHLVNRLDAFLARESGNVFKLELTSKIEPLVKAPAVEGLGVPLTDEVRKKAFRSNGRLNKGFYYDTDGFLTDGKTLYIKDKSPSKLKEKIQKVKAKNRNKEQQLDKDLAKISKKKEEPKTTKKTQKPKASKPKKQSSTDQKTTPKKDDLSKLIADFELKNNKKRGVLKKIPFKQFKKELVTCIEDIRSYDDKREKLSSERSVFKKYEDEERWEKYTKSMDLNDEVQSKKIKEWSSYYGMSYDDFLYVIYDVFHTADFEKWVKKRYKFVVIDERKKQLSLFGMGLPKRLELYTDEFKKMKVSELRKFTLDYYNEYLKGRSVEIKKHLKEVVFVNSAGRKIAKGGTMYKEKAAVVKHLKELIENSTYNNWGSRKVTDGKEVLGYLNFKSKLTVDNVKRHARISLVVYDNDKRKSELKNVDLGKKQRKALNSSQESSTTLQVGKNKTPLQNKDTKTTPKNKEKTKKGLGVPLTTSLKKQIFKTNGRLNKGYYYDADGFLTDGENYFFERKKTNETRQKLRQSASKNAKKLRKIKHDIYIEERADAVVKADHKGLGSPVPLVPIEEKPKVENLKPAIKIPPAIQPINAASSEVSEFYEVAGAEGYFLQGVEKKPVHSVVIAMDGEQGAGKTTTLYKFINAFASAGNRCLFISGEEHPSSSLAKEKVQKYLSPLSQQNTSSVGDVESVQQLYEFIEPFDVIFIDSWQKLLRMVGKLRLDEDLRKRFNGKVFVIIFQQTTTGRTKGGAEVVFDGDIIIKMVKESKFSDNYAYFDKNRYTKVPLETLHYNIASGKVYNPQMVLDAELEMID